MKKTLLSIGCFVASVFSFAGDNPSSYNTGNSDPGPNFIYIGTLNGHVYYKSIKYYNWQQADALAVSLGGHLAAITSQAENDWIYSHAGSEDFWIGLNDVAQEGTFVWSDGEPVTYTNFNDGEPNDCCGGDPGEDYVQIIGYNGKWNDLNVQSQLRLILEFDVTTVRLANITSPANGATYPAPADIPLVADALTPNGKIKSVDFYNGSTLIFTEYNYPYSRKWTNVPLGDYTITAVATDDIGGTITSAPVQIHVVPDQPPVVYVSHPLDGAIYLAPGDIHLIVDATDPVGKIKSVDFYNGDTLIFTEYNSPYSKKWVDVPVGDYSITAVATDDGGLRDTSAPVVIHVIQDQPPVISFKTPVDDASYPTPGIVPLIVNVSDPDSKLRSVDFYSDTTLLFTKSGTPYRYYWNNPPMGDHILTAIATDDHGLQTTSAPVHLHIVPNEPPLVTVTMPTDFSVFTAPAVVWVNASATDPDGKVNSLELLNDNALIKKADYSGKSSVTGNALLRNLQHGNYTISARATDDQDSSATSSTVHFSLVDDPSETFLDSTFGTNGYVKTHLYAGNQFNDAAVQKDGKLVCVGSTSDLVWKFEVPYADIVVARFNQDGSYDESFGGGIIVKDYFVYGDPWETSIDEANCVAIQPDGKIVVGGSTQYHFVLIRYNTDGSQDNTFASNGEFVTDEFGPVNALAIQQDGKILVSASDLIIRFNTDGTFDNSFGANGRLTPDFNLTGAFNIKIQPDGKMLIANSNTVARYDINGTLDQLFGTGGMLANGGWLALDSINRVLVLNDSTLTAYLPDGKNDSSFGSNGMVQIAMGNSSLAIQRDQKIIVGAWSGDRWGGSYLDFAIARYQDNGALDSVFGHSGKLISNFDNTNQSVSRDFTVKLVTANDRFYAIGGSDILDTLSFGFAQYAAVARYNVGTDKPPVITLSQPPNDTTYASPAKIFLSAIASDPDGTIKKVEFFNDTTLLYTAYKYPYTFTWSNVPDGDYMLMAMATDDQGITSLPSVVRISVAPLSDITQKVTSFTLINAETDKSIQNIADNSVVDLAALPTTQLSIRANTNLKRVGSVVFILDGQKVRTENGPPYALAGDYPRGDYHAWTLSPGLHTLTATPYSDYEGQGKQGVSLTIKFTLMPPDTRHLWPDFIYVGNLNGHDYYKSTASYTWWEADSIAVSLGGHLAAITSEAENHWIDATAVDDRYWIGLNDAAAEGTYVWSDGEPVHYIAAGRLCYVCCCSGVFRNYACCDLDFTQIFAGGVWYDFPGGIEVPFILEFEPAATTNQTKPTVNPPSESAITGTRFTVKANPNPSHNYFTIVTQSNDTKIIDIRVTDVLGRVVEARSNVPANANLQIGRKYKPGWYIVEVMQGAERRLVKIVKQ